MILLGERPAAAPTKRAVGPVSIMGNKNGPSCATCGRKIRQSQRVRRDAQDRPVHAYVADCA